MVLRLDCFPGAAGDFAPVERFEHALAGAPGEGGELVGRGELGERLGEGFEGGFEAVLTGFEGLAENTSITPSSGENSKVASLSGR